MSYCRWGTDSDVYMYQSWMGICCCMCKFKSHFLETEDDPHPFDTILDGSEEALEHLNRHLKAGHKVPDHAIRRLEQEITLAEDEDILLARELYDMEDK